MPVSRLTSEALAGDVAAAYGRAEVRLLRLIARHLSRGAEAPEWAEVKLAELQLFRRRAERVVSEAHGEAVVALDGALARSYRRGTAAGQGDLDHLGLVIEQAPLQAERAVVALHASTVSDLEAMRLPVLRKLDDVYRQAVLRAAAGTLSGATTRLQDAQQVLDELARKGVGGFRDSAGRTWSLSTYAEMATRSATSQAAINGALDRLDQGGVPLVQVSDSWQECELCRPWEGKVLSRGPVAALQRNVLTGAMERVRVDGTVDEARAAGLFHPNCTHGLSGFLPGATPLDPARPNAAGYAARQEQRRLERGVREWKRREAAALSPEARSRARGKVREWQGRVRSHVDEHDLPRKRNRESVSAAR